MSRDLPTAFFWAARIAFLGMLLFPAMVQAGTLSKPTAPRGAVVWILFASSPECPRCDQVKELLRVMKNKYPIRTRNLDIDKDKDRLLFGRLEAIHAEDKFSIPLIMVGDSILIGEREISEKLENTVKRLARKGGSSLPYLGPSGAREKSQPEARGVRTTGPSASQTESPRSECPTCERRGRPPSVGEELGNIKSFFNKFF